MTDQVMIRANPGYDPEFPIVEYPYVVLVKPMGNILGVGWQFCKTREDAVAFIATLEVKSL